MEIKFDDIIQEILFKEGLKYCYYDDPENPEFSKLMNKYLDELRQKYLITVKPFDQKSFEKMYDEFTNRFSEIKEILDENN